MVRVVEIEVCKYIIKNHYYELTFSNSYNIEGDRAEKPSRGNYPPYIHFTMQKTNRDTQDALGYLSRMLHCNVRDLSVAGTKDKRGVTVQRVALRRGNKTVEDVFKMANGLHGRRTLEEALTQRGERGVRIADFKYGRAGLELGMLKGNTFIITLRLEDFYCSSHIQ